LKRRRTRRACRGVAGEQGLQGDGVLRAGRLQGNERQEEDFPEGASGLKGSSAGVEQIVGGYPDMRKIVYAGICISAAVLAMGQAKSPAVQAFEKLKALEGEWIDVDGAFGEKGKIAVTYRVTGSGHTVVETFPFGTPQEMVTVYHLDGAKVALTHYCSGNNQPHMTSTGLLGNTIAFQFAGGANIDPAATSHMHEAKIEFVSNDEIKAVWQNWNKGKADHAASFRILRKK
jgi:hypothetical protein